MADAEALRKALENLASASEGRLEFAVRSVRNIGEDLDIDLAASKNPIYDFKVRNGSEEFRCIAYTIIIDGPKRPATRVEALGRGLAANGGTLFTLNPFLLIFDYVDLQFMAISALALFGAFAEEVGRKPHAKSETAMFSLSPNFARKTISMYAKAPAASIWHSSIAATALTLDNVVAGLSKIQRETSSRQTEIPQIVGAILTRVNSEPPAPPAPAPTAIAIVPTEDTPAPDVKLSPRIWQMVVRAVRSSPAVILVGPPGTGKTELLRRVIQELNPNVSPDKLKTPDNAPLWATPDESWTARDLVGGESVADGAIVFRPGWVLRSIQENRWLILDEVNRADMDRIFGGLMTWLTGSGSVSLGVTSTASNAPRIELGWTTAEECSTEGVSKTGDLIGDQGRVRFLAGTNWRLLGTYNALDAQRVFRFGAALGRRFLRVPIPAPEPALFEEAIAEHGRGLDPLLVRGIYSLYEAHYAAEATQLGPALFLGMCRYLRAATDEFKNSNEHRLASEDGGSGAVEQEALVSALAEAYVVNVGTWLAHMELRDLDTLQERVVASAALTPEEWSWVATMVRTLA